jgi:hypothetical protein
MTTFSVSVSINTITYLSRQHVLFELLSQEHGGLLKFIAGIES